MASLRALVSYASSFVSQIPFLNSDLRNVSPYEPLSRAPSCPLDGPVSCQNSTPITGDSCCFVHPNGRILLAQYWDPEIHASGAEEDWTLHGLWYVSPLAEGRRRNHRVRREEPTNTHHHHHHHQASLTLK